MIYIYYSNNYLEAYEKAYEFGKNINKNIIIINDTVINYNKDDISLFISFLSVSADEENQCVVLIEYPEKIKKTVIQSFLSIFENLSEYHNIILVTASIYSLPKTIISRSILFNENIKKHESYEIFFKELIDWDMREQFETIIDRHLINDKNSIEISLLLHKKFPEKRKKLYFIAKHYVSFIQNAHYAYWKMIYLILKDE